MTGREKKLIVIGIFLVMALLATVGFHDVGRQYGDYRFRYGMGISNITANELVFYLWYFVFGILAIGFMSVALINTSVSKWTDRLDRLFAWRWFVPCAAAVLLGEILLFQNMVLQYAPISDDEATYAFIAKTLLKGHLTNPSPGDIDFFKNQFVVINGSAWYGKYPIGHPLLLALGEAVNLRFLVVPIITCGTFVVTYFVGRKLFTHKQACLALCLLLLSPHFVFMGACELSHPSASLFMMLGLWSLYQIESRSSLWWPIVAGGFFGFGLLVRPFPGCLLIVVAGLWVLFCIGELSWRRRLLSLAIGVVPIALAGMALFWINQVQTGDPLQSGYHLAHLSQKDAASKGIAGMGKLGLFATGRGVVGASVGGALIRQNFWLFGWPMSLLFVFFARSRSRLAGFWGMIAAVYAYRFIMPKTVIATLGPVYVTEIVPLLALASASGMAHAREIVCRFNPTLGSRLVPAVVISSFVIAAITFFPVQIREINRSAIAWQAADQLIEKATEGKVLVFANYMVFPPHGNSWAGFPPNPSPDMDDDVIFVRRQYGRDGAKRNFEFLKRRFPDRSAWLFQVGNEGAMFKKIEKAEDFL